MFKTEYKAQESGLLSSFLRNRRINAVKDHMIPPLLDFGCGLGHLSSIQCEDYTGMDINENALSAARRLYPDKDFFNCAHLPALKQKYSTITLLAVLEHIDTPIKTLKTLNTGILRTSGILYQRNLHQRQSPTHLQHYMLSGCGLKRTTRSKYQNFQKLNTLLPDAQLSIKTFS